MADLKPFALLTFEELKEFDHKIREEYREDYQAAINGASAQIIKHCKRNLKAADYSILLNGSGRNDLLLPEYPVISITHLFIDGTRLFSEDSERTDYKLNNSAGIITLYSGIFPAGIDNVKAEFRAGFEEVPDDIKTACAILVQSRKHKANQGILGIESIAGEAGRIAFEKGMPFDVIQLLRDYVRKV